jgi:nucleotide-binding universal stress UspA family protein
MRILLAVDGSDVSKLAARAVKERPWPPGSVVRVLHVVQPLYPPPAAPWTFSVGTMLTADDFGMLDMEARMLEDARRMVRRTGESLASPGLHTEVETVLADPREGIIDQAKDWKADLIILGSHGRTGFKRWIMGSVAESVVRHAPCSVEVVRSREAAAS